MRDSGISKCAIEVNLNLESPANFKVEPAKLVHPGLFMTLTVSIYIVLYNIWL